MDPSTEEISDAEDYVSRGNGSVHESFAWTQQPRTAEVRVAVPGVTTARQLDVTVTSRELRIVALGKELLKRRWPVPVMLDETFWVLDNSADGKFVVVSVQKRDSHWWSRCFEGGEEHNLDVTKCIPDAVDFSELDKSEQADINFALHHRESNKNNSTNQEVDVHRFNALQKVREFNEELPPEKKISISQTEKDKFLEDFKRIHPTVDFSKTKII